MSKLAIVNSALLALHGLIHLMGTVVYLRLGYVEGLTYKTTLLGGRWGLGTQGIAFYGALWALAAGGFVAAALALLTGWASWRPLLPGVTLLSLTLTTLDHGQAYAGIVVNLLILAALWLGPRLPG